MKTTLSVLFCLASATLLSACQGPADSLLDCPSGDENCQEANTKNEQGRLEMPPLNPELDGSLQTMEGWLQAAQLEAEDGIPRLAAWTAHGLNLLPYTVKDGRVIVGGDVDMGPLSVLESARDRGVALQEVWFPEGHIPWYTNGISTTQLSKIEAGLKILTEHTPLTFEKVSSSADVRALEFKGTTNCSSFYGGLTYDYWNDDDAQPVLRLCQDNGARSVSTVLHEMGHALGFPHEFQREDRDDHVDVCFNLDPFNYAKMGGIFWGGGHFHLSPFDLKSVMNSGYSGCVSPIDGSSWPHPKYDGHTQDLSIHDINSIYRVYAGSLDDPAEGAQFGTGIATGDFDADGIEDMAVVTNEPSSGTYNKIDLLFYRGVETDSAEDGAGTTYIPWFSENFGYTADKSVSPSIAAGDFNGDGIDDLAVGDPSYNKNRGRVSIITINTPERFSDIAPWGGHGFESQKWVYPTDVGFSNGFSHQFGASLATGKFSSSTKDDLVIGVPGARAGSSSKKGGFALITQAGGAIVHLKNGESNDTQITWNPNGVAFITDYDSFGAEITTLPGFCTDEGGLDTFVVADPEYKNGRGQVIVYGCASENASPESPVALKKLTGGSDGMHYGSSLAAFETLASVGSTPRYFVAIGAPNKSNGSLANVGKVYLREFDTDGNRTSIATFTPSQRNGDDLFGSALSVHQYVGSSGCLDLNYVRIAIGMPGALSDGIRSGKTYLWHPWKSGAVSKTATVFTPSNKTEGALYGSSLATIRDGQRNGGFAIGAPQTELTVGYDFTGYPLKAITEAAGGVEVRLDQSSSLTSWSSDSTLLSAGTTGDMRPTN